MELKLKSSAKPLLVVAHPDDESLFFGALLAQNKNLKWTVLCLTDGNAEGRGNDRHQELLRAAKALGVKKLLHWDFPDNYPGRLPLKELGEKLKTLDAFNMVFTHGILGEYGHPHHQDTSFAVHREFSKRKIPVWSAAYNSLGSHSVTVKAATFQLKAKVLQEIYRLETARFLNILTITQTEHYHLLAPKIVDNIYQWILHPNLPLPKALGPYAPLKKFLEDRTYLKGSEGFFKNYLAR
jgi:LmbE family N-acetylglucosaminyl deacetylase